MSNAALIEIASVNLGNPGQFFACCGLLELAERIWPGATGSFTHNNFLIQVPAVPDQADAGKILGALSGCELTNTMTPAQRARLAELSSLKNAAEFASEKKLLEKLRREEPLLLPAPFHLRLDWFLDDSAGGSRFKTWAGQQSVLEIATAMKHAIETSNWRSLPESQWFSMAVRGCGVPFNLDSDLGAQGSALDVGFSFDPLAASAATRIETNARPIVELLAFVGLQRFRPRQLKSENRFLYRAWNRWLPPELAAPAACGLLPCTGESYEFRLLYRTKYLKSFLPAIPYAGALHD